MPLRLLLVHAHPDDETLNHGATIAAALAHGHQVDLVTCSRGEEGEVIGEAEQHRTSEADDTLAELREAELAAALEALAGTAGDGGRVGHAYLDALPPVTGRDVRASPYRDSGMVVLPGGRAGVPPDVRPECFAVADLDEAAGRLAGLLRRRRPHVVLTYGPQGGYGHPDHVMAHRVTVRALELAADDRDAFYGRDDHDGHGQDDRDRGDRDRDGRDGEDGGAWSVPWVYGAAGDADALRAWLRVQPPAAGAWDPDGPLPQMFLPAHLVDATVRAEAFLPAKVAALRALPSQVTVLDDRPGSATFVLSNDVPQPLTGVEAGVLLRRVGPVAQAPVLAADDPLAALLLPPGTRPRAAPVG